MDEHTIPVEALEDHTTDGVPHKAGERYDAPATSLDFLVQRGLAKPVAAEPATPTKPSKPAAR